MTKRTKAAAASAKKQPTTPAATTKSTTPTKSFEQTKPEWLPLHVAMMLFFPTYASSEKAFHDELKRLVTVLTGSNDFSVAEIVPYVVRIACGGVGLVIDAEHGEIEIERDVVGNEWEVIFNCASIRARIDQFPEAFPATEIKPEFREAARRQHDLALRLIRSLKDNFRQAVHDGGAEIFGRWRDLKAPFEPVHPDQWYCLRKAPDADWSPGTDMSTITGDGRRGDLTIYSVHVQPHRKQQDSSAKAISECTLYLADRIRNRANDHITLSDLEIEARERWPQKRLSDRAIKRCLQEAKRQANSAELFRPGRKPKLIHSTQ
jgi:hypothetical protein